MTVSYLGGRMYGDGEYVVEFHVSRMAPLTATVLGPNDSFFELAFADERGSKPSLALAKRAIAAARAWKEPVKA